MGYLPRGQFKLAKSSSLITGEAAGNGPKEVAPRVERVAVELIWVIGMKERISWWSRLFLCSDLWCLVSEGEH